jgi:hypothetical protein
MARKKQTNNKKVSDMLTSAWEAVNNAFTNLVETVAKAIDNFASKF